MYTRLLGFLLETAKSMIKVKLCKSVSIARFEGHSVKPDAL